MKLDNTAIQFLSPDKKICLRLETEGSMIFISVRDYDKSIAASGFFSPEELSEMVKYRLINREKK